MSEHKKKRDLKQPEGAPPQTTRSLRLDPLRPNASGAAAGDAGINDQIKTALGDKYEAESHSISDPRFKPAPDGNPNEVVEVANNYISVAQNISRIDPYVKLLGVKNAVNAISIAAETFNAAIGARNSGTIKAIVIPKLLGGGKRKRNKKIGTKKKQYKRK